MSVAAAWMAAVEVLGGHGPAAGLSGAELEQRYEEPHRRYHGLAHIRAVLADAGSLADELQFDATDRALLELAVCAHDVVYDATPGADERASAAWARDALTGAGVATGHVDRVAGLVLDTLTHDADPSDRVAAVLSDADLAILGSEPAAYDRYVVAVRQEFAAVSDERWRTGREAVLVALANRPRLYVTDAGHARWDAAARANLARERRSLR